MNHPSGRSRVAVFGDVSIDLLTQIPESERSSADEKVRSTYFESFLGGTGLNTARVAQSFGHPVAFFTAVGSDHFGDWAQSQLADLGLSHVEVKVADGKTPVVFIVMRGDSRQLIVNVSGDLPATPVVRADVVDCSAAIYVTQSLSSLRYLLDRGSGGRLVLGFEAWMARTVGFRALLEGCWIGITNEVGMQTLRDATGTGGLQVPVVETRGSDGCVIHRPDGGVDVIEAYPVSAIDATGAGDTFAAALVAELADGTSLGAAAHVASVAAAISTTSLGPEAVLPDLHELRVRATQFYR